MFILLIFREGPNTCELRSAKQSVFLFNCNKYPWLLREFLWCIGTTQGFLLLLIRALDIGVNYHRQDCSSHKVIAIVNTILLASRSFYSLIMPMKWSTIAMDSIIKILLAKICRKRTISIKLLHLVEFKPFCLFLINPPHTQTHTHPLLLVLLDILSKFTTTTDICVPNFRLKKWMFKEFLIKAKLFFVDLSHFLWVVKAIQLPDLRQPKLG